jgi:DNA-binding XRE family transcriptional regulator
MQPNEVKVIRKGLGLSQAELGDVLGLTGQFIGMMERGVKPIEKRTAFALRYLAEHPDQAVS